MPGAQAADEGLVRLEFAEVPYAGRERSTFKEVPGGVLVARGWPACSPLEELCVSAPNRRCSVEDTPKDGRHQGHSQAAWTSRMTRITSAAKLELSSNVRSKKREAGSI